MIVKIVERQIVMEERYKFRKALQQEVPAVFALIMRRVAWMDRVGIRQVTVDHSVVQMMVNRGELTPEQAKTYPGKSLITRAIGTESMVACDIFHKKVSSGDFFLLCSDGLSNLMDDQEILFEVAHGQDKSKCCQRLLDIAKHRGAPDNVTSVLVAV